MSEAAQNRDNLVSCQAQLQLVIRDLTFSAGSLVGLGMGVGSLYREANDLADKIIDLRHKVRERAGMPS